MIFRLIEAQKSKYAFFNLPLAQVGKKDQAADAEYDASLKDRSIESSEGRGRFRAANNLKIYNIIYILY